MRGLVFCSSASVVALASFALASPSPVTDVATPEPSPRWHNKHSPTPTPTPTETVGPERDTEPACADVVDGDGSLTRSSAADLPNGTRVDLGAHLHFEVLLAAPSCPEVTYTLKAFGSSLDPTSDDHNLELGDQTLNGDSQAVLDFDLDYTDLAAARDPVDLRGMARCVYLVVTTSGAGGSLDRAPDNGLHVLCPEGHGDQAPFH